MQPRLLTTPLFTVHTFGLLLAVSSPHPAQHAMPLDQKLTTLDSAIRFANLIGSMNDAFSALRSASVTPRATLQAPQTKTGTLSLIFASNSVSGGNPTP